MNQTDHELYRQLFLRHDPQRRAYMLPPGQLKKYDDHTGPITDEMIARQLDGSLTIAAPIARDGLAHCLPLDVDAGGLPAIHALMAEAQRRGLWCFGEYSPRPGWTEEEQRGYVWILFAELESAERIQILGHDLIQTVSQPGWKIETRAHGADTRLPLGRHTHTGAFSQVIMPTGQLLDATADRRAALMLIAEQLRPATADQLPPLPARPTPGSIEIQATTAPGVRAAYDQAQDIEQLLMSYGAKKAGHRLYLCPFHGDRTASLTIYTDRSGLKVCRCMSTHSNCPLSLHGRYSAFDVFCLGEKLTTHEAIKQLTQNQTRQGGQGSPPPADSPPPAPPPPPAPAETATAPEKINPYELWQQNGEITTSYRDDPGLRAYIKTYGGTSGVYLLHQAREKLGEQATNAAINAEIARHRGQPYTDRRLRQLNAMRRQLINDYAGHDQQSGSQPPSWDEQATAPTPPEIISAPPALSKESCIHTGLACEGGQSPEAVQADDQAQPGQVETGAFCLTPRNGAFSLDFEPSDEHTGPHGAIYYPQGAAYVPPNHVEAQRWYAAIQAAYAPVIELPPAQLDMADAPQPEPPAIATAFDLPAPKKSRKRKTYTREELISRIFSSKGGAEKYRYSDEAKAKHCYHSALYYQDLLDEMERKQAEAQPPQLRSEHQPAGRSTGPAIAPPHKLTPVVLNLFLGNLPLPKNTPQVETPRPQRPAQVDPEWQRLQAYQANYWEAHGDPQRAAFIRQAAGIEASTCYTFSDV